MTYTHPDFRDAKESNRINDLARGVIIGDILNVNRELQRFLVVGVGQARYTQLLLSARKEGTIRTLQPAKIAKESKSDTVVAKAVKSFTKKRKARKAGAKSLLSLEKAADFMLDNNLSDSEALDLLNLL